MTENQEILSRKRVLIYNKEHQVEEKKVYDSKGEYKYSIKNTYQDGLLVSNRPSWYLTTFKYNSRRQLKERHKQGGPIETFTQDASGRLKEMKLKINYGGLTENKI